MALLAFIAALAFFFISPSQSLLLGIVLSLLTHSLSPTRSQIVIFTTSASCYRFGTFEEFKNHSCDERGVLTPHARFLCGLGAGVCEALLAVTPMETIKVKFIHDQTHEAVPRFRGFVHGVGLIVRQDGSSLILFLACSLYACIINLVYHYSLVCIP